MNTNTPFRTALVFSIGVHALFMTPVSSLFTHPKDKPRMDIEVTYMPIPEEIFSEALPEETQANVSIEEEAPAESAPKAEKAPTEQKEAAEQKPEINKDNVLKQMLLAGEALDLSALSAHMGSDDSLNYLKAIRNKISRYIHRKYTSSMGKGEALVHFVLSSNGSVRSVKILRDDLGGAQRLRNICLDSVYHSSPFSPLPEELSLAQAAFKINISFKRH